MHYYAYVIIETEKSILDRLPMILEDEHRRMEEMNRNLESMSFDEKIEFAQKVFVGKTVTEYGKITSALLAKVQKTLTRFESTTDDENRKFDSWNFIDIFTPESLLKEPEASEYFPEAIMTSDCRWLHMGWSANDVENKNESIKWDALVKTTLESNIGKSVVLLINCDS